MDAHQLEKAISLASFITPLPVNREGIKPTHHEIKMLDTNTVSVAWVRDDQRTEFVIEQRQGAWVHASGVTSTIESYCLWFPGFVRWAQPNEPFDTTQYLNYLRGK